jgi:hypothetical protein
MVFKKEGSFLLIKYSIYPKAVISKNITCSGSRTKALSCHIIHKEFSQKRW